jgi:hypothetical protein
MKVEIGEYDLVYSETIIQFGNNPVKITLRDMIEGDFTFHLNFIYNPQNPAVVTNQRPINKFNVQIDFVNFNQPNFVGNTVLLHLGTLMKKNLFLNYRVFDLANAGKTLIVNFYTQK